jgi:hypothetical protein
VGWVQQYRQHLRGNRFNARNGDLFCCGFQRGWHKPSDRNISQLVRW